MSNQELVKYDMVKERMKDTGANKDYSVNIKAIKLI